MKIRSQLIVNILVTITLLNSCSKEPILPESKEAVLSGSPYIRNVFEYVYGPGQHASLIQPASKGSDFIGEPWINNKSFTSLGGWGGYIIAGFDHFVSNSEGPDFCVYTQPSVSSEPGVVFVMEDLNNDNLPNDGEWMEIKGSEYDNPETIHRYSVTYKKPDSSGLVGWQDNKGKSGYLIPAYGNESWWWNGYGDKPSVTFTGVKLPDAYINTSLDPAAQYWSARTGLFKYGYAECYNNQDYNQKLKANFFDISDAVDASGNPINLKSIKFIKIQSGVFQIAGWLNEISTEISGAADIHLLDPKMYQ